MKTILVPTDFNPSSNGAIALGTEIAKKSNSGLAIQHNVPTLVNWSEQDRASRWNHPEVMMNTREAEHLMSTLVESLPDNLVVNKIITHGITPDEIVRSAKSLNASLIVIGSHGVENRDRNFIGSTAQRVLRSAGCPVVLAKHGAGSRAPKRILFPFTFNGNIQKPFSEIAEFALQVGATIHLVFVNTPADFRSTRVIFTQMREFSVGFPGVNFAMDIYNHSDVVTGILEHAEAIEADLIALVTHDRLHQPQYQIGITEAVAYNSDIPVLSVNVRAHKSVLV